MQVGGVKSTHDHGREGSRVGLYRSEDKSTCGTCGTSDVGRGGSGQLHPVPKCPREEQAFHLYMLRRTWLCESSQLYSEMFNGIQGIVVLAGFQKRVNQFALTLVYALLNCDYCTKYVRTRYIYV